MAEIASGVTSVMGMLTSVSAFFSTPIGVLCIAVPVVGIVLAIISRMIPRG